MRKKKIVFLSLIGIAFTIFVCIYLKNTDMAVLSPQGLIAFKERKLLIDTTLLMLIVIIPTLFLTFLIAWRYREGNQTALYTPDADHHPLAELVWWGVPFLIVAALSFFVWNSCHDLDPFKPLISTTRPLKIQVVALQWKWLFLYPEQKIATVNYLQIPQQTPIEFEITADAPMNSFWIPQLGGQIYAMAGMNSKLHLIADQTGTYRGSSANLSGQGFSGMVFSVVSTTSADFNNWVESVKQSAQPLNYQALMTPSENNPATCFSSTPERLYEQIIGKYMKGMDHAME